MPEGSIPSAPDSAGQEADGVVRLYLGWLEERERAGGPALEELCARHPGWRERLTALHAAHERARALLEPDAPTPPEAPASPSAEARYEVRGEIARGGMGAVLEVYDPSLRRTIAMKVVRTDPAFRAGETREEAERHQSRLLAEAQILAQLDHPGVVSIHELGRDARGRAYFTMKRVQGHDFGVVIRAYRGADPEWSLARAVGVLARVCEALAYAHQKGVVHRDLKPANVMVGRFGEVFVMDWGLARVAGRAQAPPVPIRATRLETELANADPARGPGAPAHEPAPEPSVVHTDRESGSRPGSSSVETLVGAVVGTPGYMSPEQARSDASAIGPRSDVYALGAMLYHLLAGRHPYARERRLDSAELVQAILAGPPEPLAGLARGAPEELVAIAERAMARAPEQRYPGMLALGADLQAWLEGRVVRAHRTGAWAELVKWVGRNRGAAAAILAVILGLAANAAIQTLLRRDVERARSVSVRTAEELRREDAHNRVALASAALASGEISHLRALLAGCPADLRGFEWRHLWRESDTSTRTLEFPGLDVKSAFVLPGGRELLVAGAGAHRLVVQDLASGERVRTLELAPESAVNGASLSADGELVAALVYFGDLRLWRTRDWSELPALDARLHGWQDVEFAPRGRLLAAFGTEGVQLWEVERGTELGLLALPQALAGASDIADVAWSPDATRLFAAAWDGGVGVWDVATRTLVTVLRDSSARMQALECSPDGRWLAGGDWDSRLYVWDARTLARVLRSDRIGGQVQALAWSPDSHLVAVGGSGTVHLFEADAWERVGRLVGETGRVHSLAFADGGATLVAGSSLGSVRFFDLEHGAGRTLLHADGREPPAGVAFGRERELAAVAWGHGMVELWDTRTRTRVRSLHTGARIRHLDWSRDGASLAVADWAQGILVLAPEDGSVRRRLALAQPTELHFDPSGTRLAATAQDGHLRVWTLDDGLLAWEAALAPEQHGWPGDLFGASWSPDGSEVVACNFDGRVQVRDAASGALRREALRPGMLFVQFAPDGSGVLASAYADNRGMEWLDAHTLAPRWTSARTSHLWPVVSPDGARVFSANWSGFLGVWDARTGRLVTEIEGLPPGNPRLAVSPDGERVVLAAGKYVSVFEAGR